MNENAGVLARKFKVATTKLTSQNTCIPASGSLAADRSVEWNLSVLANQKYL